MPRRPGRPDFHQVIHNIYERIGAGESCHDADEAAAKTAEPPPSGRENEQSEMGKKAAVRRKKAKPV